MYFGPFCISVRYEVESDSYRHKSDKHALMCDVYHKIKTSVE